MQTAGLFWLPSPPARFHTLKILALFNARFFATSKMQTYVAHIAKRFIGSAGIALALFAASCWVCTDQSWAQRAGRKYPRSIPPAMKADEFDGIFFDNALSQLQGDRPTSGTMHAASGNSATNNTASISPDAGSSVAPGSDWKSFISDVTIEDLVKESKNRLDQTISTPAKFASGGFQEARREFTLLATLMAIIDQYPEQIRWKNSANYAQRIFAKVAANSVVGTPPVHNEAKLRHQDLQDLLKGSTISGNADEVSWEQTADRGPIMQILDWSLRSNLSPLTNNDKDFENAPEEVIRYAELIAAYGRVLQQEGMTDADDESYTQMSSEMTAAALELVKATQLGNADAARTAVGRIDQSCSKCHEGYR